MDDPGASPISENGEVLEGSVSSAAASGSGRSPQKLRIHGCEPKAADGKQDSWQCQESPEERRALARAHKCPESFLHIEG